MTGVTIELSQTDLNRINLRLSQMIRLDPHDLLETIGGIVESQTRRRLSEEKENPDGIAWEDWSPKYAATRRTGQNLLESEGNLIDSIESYVSGGTVRIGSNLIYAAIHQAGGEAVGMAIPARPYLGLSADNRDEIAEVVEDWVMEQVA